MATLQRKKIHGNWYWYITECRRIRGKPRPVVLKYIGSSDKLMSMLMGLDSLSELSITSYEHGSVYCLHKIAEEAGIAAIFKKHFSGQVRDGMSVAESLLLISIYRACRPASKRAFSEWAAGTTLPHIMGFEVRRMTSQHFWDQMNAVKEEEIERAEEEIAQTLIKTMGISIDILLYDVTNFFTFIASDNKRNKLCQRGRNKQKRDDLRQFNLAILTSRNSYIPLLSEVYEGNIPDVKSFASLLSKIRKRLSLIAHEIEDITLVFDKGNYSKEIQKELQEARVKWVGSLSILMHSDYARIRRNRFHRIKLCHGKKISCFRMEKDLWGQKMAMVVLFSKKLYQGQVLGFKKALAKAIAYLKAIHGTRKNIDTVTRELKSFLSKEHIKEVLIPQITRKGNRIQAYWKIDKRAYHYLLKEYFGRKVLFSTNLDWTDAEIIEAYYGLGKIENYFKILKNPFHFSVRPQYHWTDHKIKVHVFTCLVGLILTAVLYKKVQENHIAISPTRMLHELSKVRESLIMELTGLKGKPRARRKLEEMGDQAFRLYKLLSI
jgi:transposase